MKALVHIEILRADLEEMQELTLCFCGGGRGVTPTFFHAICQVADAILAQKQGFLYV